jgi:uncharacterized glyoxalase superfamily protein PhnB
MRVEFNRVMRPATWVFLDEIIAICVKYYTFQQWRLGMADPSRIFIPTLYYRDPIAAIRWLEQAFGFELNALVTDDKGRVGHSEMSYAGAVLAVHSEFSSPELIGPAEMKSPMALGGGCCQSIRVAVESDIDGHCERARKAGARVTAEPADQFYGERIYRALDPEGHLWVFAQLVQTLTFEEMEKATGLKFATKLDEVTS